MVLDPDFVARGTGVACEVKDVWAWPRIQEKLTMLEWIVEAIAMVQLRIV